jgi:anti-sigma regulatory factor (Ser/Thr protein kinase)
MAKTFDSATDCRLLYNSSAQNESALILLRSKLSAVAQRLGIPDWKRENMLLVASELVTNNVKHAGGRGLIQIWQQPGPVLDIVALDFGPGIANLPQAEEDGYSTANTLGKGLGSIRRLSDELLIYTQLESSGRVKKWSGTVFLARFFPGDNKEASDAGILPGFKIGLFSRSLSDLRYNGDRIYLHHTDSKLRWLHLDGLGHGERAQEATANLGAHLAKGENPGAVLAAVNHQLTGSRGAVAVIGEIDLKQNEIQVVGVGDMHAHVYDKEQLNNIPFAPGILGREHRTPALFRAAFGKKSLVVTASDGIRRNWDTANFTGLFNQHPQLIAYTLGNIMARISDDQSICVSTIA